MRVSWTSVINITGNLSEMQILRPHPRSIESEAWGWSPDTCFASCAYNSAAHSSLGATGLGPWD